MSDNLITLGGITDVWECNYRGMGVSTKSLKVPLDNDQTLRKSFFKEAIVWKRLRHPNIVPFIGVTTNPLQVVSEWMPNGTLLEFVRENPDVKRISLVQSFPGIALDRERDLSKLLDVAEGLDYLHANHITHGNLKGANILVDHDRRARLTNFELASIVRGVNSTTRANQCTAAWAAPEILEGKGTITRGADVFAFGMVMIEVFTGRRPFSELTTPVITSKIIDGGRPARPQEAHELGLTDSVWEMTVRCWHQDPSQRPTMMEVVRLARECYRMAAPWTVVTDIPVKVLTDNILPFCETKDVISLGCTNTFFALTTDKTLWKRKLAVNYDFPALGTARTSDWKLIYQRLRNPRVFVWGEKSSGQLGLPWFPETTHGNVPFPVELHLPGVRVVSLAASDKAFHALGADGSVYVWGTLNRDIMVWDGTRPVNSVTTVRTPLKLQLPAPTRTISCSSFRAVTLDANSTVWNFESWGRPYRLVSPLLDCSSPETTPIQIQYGSSFSAVLVGSGDVYAWSLTDAGWRGITISDWKIDESTRAIVSNDGTVIPCHTWEKNMDPVKLPIPPGLPDLPMTGLAEEERRTGTKFIKIAAVERSLVGLTNKGHVLKINKFTALGPFSMWHYLPNFSDIGEVKKHPAFHTTTSNIGRRGPPRVKLSSDTMLITHLSGYRRSFFAYSSSLVLEGLFNTTPVMFPGIDPELQNGSVASVVRGDNHFGALTSSGKLMTWGDYSCGALGLGDPGKLPVGSPGGYAKEEQRAQAQVSWPPYVTVLSEVGFYHGLKAEGRAKTHCFAAAAGASNTAALVVDLAGDD